MRRLILYAACLEGSDPVRLFEKRINARRGKSYVLSYLQLPSLLIPTTSRKMLLAFRCLLMPLLGLSTPPILLLCWCSEPGYDFDKESLVEYNHMSFGGPPVTANTLEEADKLLLHDQKESEIGKLPTCPIL